MLLTCISYEMKQSNDWMELILPFVNVFFIPFCLFRKSGQISKCCCSGKKHEKSCIGKGRERDSKWKGRISAELRVCNGESISSSWSFPMTAQKCLKRTCPTGKYKNPCAIVPTNLTCIKLAHVPIFHVFRTQNTFEKSEIPANNISTHKTQEHL